MIAFTIAYCTYFSMFFVGGHAAAFFDAPTTTTRREINETDHQSAPMSVTTFDNDGDDDCKTPRQDPEPNFHMDFLGRNPEGGKHLLQKRCDCNYVQPASTEHRAEKKVTTDAVIW